MKITSFYYLAYPDTSPPDPNVAMSEVYLEVSRNDGDLDHFDDTYAITVCTIGYLQKYLQSYTYYANQSLIVVATFDDDTIKNVLEALLPQIDNIAIKK